MFCPRCGKADQMPETYCRQCGLYLFDYSNPRRRQSPPEEHFKANTVLSDPTLVEWTFEDKGDDTTFLVVKNWVSRV